MSHKPAYSLEQKNKGVAGEAENVSELDTVVRGNKYIDLIGGDYGGFAITTRGRVGRDRLFWLEVRGR